VTTRHDSTLILSSEHHQAIKNHIDTLSVQDQRKKDPKPIDEKQKAHANNPNRKHADYTSAKNMLLQINNSTSLKIQDNIIIHTASSAPAAKTLHQIWTRCAYLANKDYVTEYTGNILKMSIENFNILFSYFFPEQKNNIALLTCTKQTYFTHPNNPATLQQQSSNSKDFNPDNFLNLEFLNKAYNLDIPKL
jgi:hypothetical protein